MNDDIKNSWRWNWQSESNESKWLILVSFPFFFSFSNFTFFLEVCNRTGIAGLPTVSMGTKWSHFLILSVAQYERWLNRPILLIWVRKCNHSIPVGAVGNQWLSCCRALTDHFLCIKCTYKDNYILIPCHLCETIFNFVLENA